MNVPSEVRTHDLKTYSLVRYLLRYRASAASLRYKTSWFNLSNYLAELLQQVHVTSLETRVLNQCSFHTSMLVLNLQLVYTKLEWMLKLILNRNYKAIQSVLWNYIYFLEQKKTYKRIANKI